MTLNNRTKTVQDEEIRHAFLAGARVSDLALKYGCSPSWICTIVKPVRHQVIGRKRGGSRADLKTISTLHSRVGATICAYRTLQNNLSLTEFGREVQITAKRLASIESGVASLTLHEMERITNRLNLKISDLLEGRLV